MERTITIRGAVVNICQAETKISAKLRQCWENDMANAVSEGFNEENLFLNGSFFFDF